MKRLSLYAVMLVVLANAFILAGAAWNRSGEADAVVTLDERELRLPWGSEWRENTGIVLELAWRRADDRYWPGDEKLRELGFRTRDGSGDFDREARSGYLVLERDDADWARRLREAQAELARVRADIAAGRRKADDDGGAEYRFNQAQGDTRLRNVDLGADPVELRSRYPDRARYLVVPVEVTVYYPYAANEAGETRLGTPSIRLLRPVLHVPSRLHPALTRLTGLDPRRDFTGSLSQVPRYQLDLHYGRRYQPWLENIRAADPLP